MVGINNLLAVDGVFFLIFGSCEIFIKIINPKLASVPVSHGSPLVRQLKFCDYFNFKKTTNCDIKHCPTLVHEELHEVAHEVDVTASD